MAELECELVENMACGKVFIYCRTHKVENRDCPKRSSSTPGEFSISPGGYAPFSFESVELFDVDEDLFDQINKAMRTDRFLCK